MLYPLFIVINVRSSVSLITIDLNFFFFFDYDQSHKTCSAL